MYVTSPEEFLEKVRQAVEQARVIADRIPRGVWDIDVGCRGYNGWLSWTGPSSETFHELIARIKMVSQVLGRPHFETGINDGDKTAVTAHWHTADNVWVRVVPGNSACRVHPDHPGRMPCWEPPAVHPECQKVLSEIEEEYAEAQ